MSAVIIDRVILARAVVEWSLRTAGFLLLCWGVVSLLRAGITTIWASMQYRQQIAMGLMTRETTTLVFVVHIPELVAGAAILVLARHISRWLVTIPPDTCPRCDHPRSATAEGTRCPECGLEGVNEPRPKAP